MHGLCAYQPVYGPAVIGFHQHHCTQMKACATLGNLHNVAWCSLVTSMPPQHTVKLKGMRAQHSHERGMRGGMTLMLWLPSCP